MVNGGGLISFTLLSHACHCTASCRPATAASLVLTPDRAQKSHSPTSHTITSDVGCGLFRLHLLELSQSAGHEVKLSASPPLVAPPDATKSITWSRPPKGKLA